MTGQPTKNDIEAVFQRLRAIPANKTCFDCSAKNPTWASVTYGVFICIDCSAVHRSLGVHLTFVRSTQLDTNWTWLQLRQMQVGGNANAVQFFMQHNCNTADSQKKYNSRSAQLYREKIQQLAVKACQNNTQFKIEQSGLGPNENKLHIQPQPEEKENKEEEEDFFAEHEKFENLTISLPEDPKVELIKQPKTVSLRSGDGPTVNFDLNVEQQHKSTIGARKVQPKRTGLGAKKGGLGATKVKTNFADLEKEAALAEEFHLRLQEESAKAVELSAKEKEERQAAVRLAYKDLSMEKQKREDQLKKMDPHKAEQMERLGMGFQTAKSGVSHSILNDMQTIEQENVPGKQSNLASLVKMRMVDTNNFFEDFSYSSSFNMDRDAKSQEPESSYKNSNSVGYLLLNSNKSSLSNKDSWAVIDEPLEKPKSISTKSVEKSTKTSKSRSFEVDHSDIAQKKFGSAKAISSEQFFNDRANDHEHEANLSRFQGSSSISSSEYFGTNSKDNFQGGNKFQNIELDDVRESVRQGVTKVAGKISSMANGVMSSLQERYGY